MRLADSVVNDFVAIPRNQRNYRHAITVHRRRRTYNIVIPLKLSQLRIVVIDIHPRHRAIAVDKDYFNVVILPAV